MFAIARKNDSAANMNAQSVVIHPLHRPGAPGVYVAPGGSRGRGNHERSAPPTSTPVDAQESAE